MRSSAVPPLSGRPTPSQGGMGGYQRPPTGGHRSRLLGGQQGGPPGGLGSVMSSEIDSTSFVDSEEDASTRLSATTETTNHTSRNGRRRRRKHRLPIMSRASSFSSITDSTMSLNIVTVTLSMGQSGTLLPCNLSLTLSMGQSGALLSCKLSLTI